MLLPCLTQWHLNHILWVVPFLLCWKHIKYIGSCILYIVFLIKYLTPPPQPARTQTSTEYLVKISQKVYKFVFCVSMCAQVLNHIIGADPPV